MNGLWKSLGEFISKIGFPIFVAMYLLWQITPAIQDSMLVQVKLVERMETVIRQQEELIRELRREK